MLFFGLYRQELEVERIIPHEKYRHGNKLKSDIALIKLKKDLDSTYMPACLAPKLEDYTGKEGSLYGWGATADVLLGEPCLGAPGTLGTNIRPRKVIFGHFIDFEYFGSDFSCFYIVKTPKIEMASRLSFMGL